eukprot:m.270258 g.270258  ORF g.270258 m.270258 type:complete len:114 (-) comp16075_c0_seq1:832-1173(-)
MLNWNWNWNALFVSFVWLSVLREFLGPARTAHGGTPPSHHNHSPVGPVATQIQPFNHWCWRQQNMGDWRAASVVGCAVLVVTAVRGQVFTQNTSTEELVYAAALGAVQTEVDF